MKIRDISSIDILDFDKCYVQNMILNDIQEVLAVGWTRNANAGVTVTSKTYNSKNIS